MEWWLILEYVVDSDLKTKIKNSALISWLLLYVSLTEKLISCVSWPVLSQCHFTPFAHHCISQVLFSPSLAFLSCSLVCSFPYCIPSIKPSAWHVVCMEMKNEKLNFACAFPAYPSECAIGNKGHYSASFILQGLPHSTQWIQEDWWEQLIFTMVEAYARQKSWWKSTLKEKSFFLFADVNWPVSCLSLNPGTEAIN